MPKVHNKHHKTAGPNAVYIGRGSPYGNPFVIGEDGDRDEVCDKFEELLLDNPELVSMIKRELKGKDLVCYCAPKRCHGDTLLKIANSVDYEVVWEQRNGFSEVEIRLENGIYSLYETPQYGGDFMLVKEGSLEDLKEYAENNLT